MLTLLLVVAVLAAPMTVLLVAGPGEVELMTQPKNLGVYGAELPVRSARLVEDELTSEDILTGLHASTVPAGMRAVAVNA